MRRTILASAAVVGALLLAGCSAGASSSSSSGPVDMVEPNGVTGAEGGASSDALTKEAEQSVITTGWITITVDDPAAATEQAVALTDELDGRIDSRSQQAGSENTRASAQLTIRVPADELDTAVERLGELGTIEQVSLNASDVTLQVRDLDAQIDALQASVDRLTALVDQAASTADLVELETAISDRQAQLDSLKSQQQYLADQIDYSTITLDLQQKGALPSNAPGDFWSGLAAGWAALLAAGSGLLVVAGMLIPWLLPLAVIAIIVIVIVLIARRGSHRRTPPAPPTGPVGAPVPHDPAPVPAEHATVGTRPEV